MRLVSQGIFDAVSARWSELPEDLRNLIMATLSVSPQDRPSVTEVLAHRGLVRVLSFDPEKPPEGAGDNLALWLHMSGLQRLGWLAAARAVSEPELHPHFVEVASQVAYDAAVQAGAGQEISTGADKAYLWRLAQMLAVSAPDKWLQRSGAWPEIVRLAFCYLDVDSDGLLSCSDLATHIELPLEQALEEASAWLLPWIGQPGFHTWEEDVTPQSSRSIEEESSISFGMAGLTPTAFQTALLGATWLPGAGSKSVSGSCCSIKRFSMRHS